MVGLEKKDPENRMLRRRNLFSKRAGLEQRLYGVSVPNGTLRKSRIKASAVALPRVLLWEKCQTEIPKEKKVRKTTMEQLRLRVYDLWGRGKCQVSKGDARGQWQPLLPPC